LQECFQESSLSKSYSIGTEFVHKNLSYRGIICSPLKTIDQDGNAVKGFYLAMAGSSISPGKDFLFSPADLDYDLEKAEGQIGLQRDQHSCLDIVSSEDILPYLPIDYFNAISRYSREWLRQDDREILRKIGIKKTLMKQEKLDHIRQLNALSYYSTTEDHVLDLSVKTLFLSKTKLRSFGALPLGGMVESAVVKSDGLLGIDTEQITFNYSDGESCEAVTSWLAIVRIKNTSNSTRSLRNLELSFYSKDGAFAKASSTVKTLKKVLHPGESTQNTLKLTLFESFTVKACLKYASGRQKSTVSIDGIKLIDYC